MKLNKNIKDSNLHIGSLLPNVDSYNGEERHGCYRKNIIIGNLIDLVEQGHLDIIIHGCNCFHVMGAGVAKEIKARYPRAYKADCGFTCKGDITKLGHYSWAIVSAPDGHTFTIINAYTQFKYGVGGPHVDYSAIKLVFEAIASQYTGKRIGYPLIGAGFGGGDWNIIQPIINTALQGMAHTLVTFK